MLTKETFVDAIRKIRQHEELMDRLDSVCREFGSFRPSLDFGNLHLQALLEVLKEVMDDEALKRPLANNPEIPQKVQAMITIKVPKTFLFFILFTLY